MDKPIIFDRKFPEIQVRAPYTSFHNEVVGSVMVTAGFMEPKGHGYKSTPVKAIYANGAMKTIEPGNYNIGFDYSSGYGTNVIAFYSGVVVKAGKEGGYGPRIHVKLDQKFKWQGKEYDCFQAYAHCLRLLKSVGQRVEQGEAIAIEAGHGSTGPRNYGSHVDQDTYFFFNGEKVRINFELLANPNYSVIGSKNAFDNSVKQLGILKKGDKSLGVQYAQIVLGLTPDKVFGAEMEAKVKEFQKKEKLTVDGVIGEDTGRALGLTDSIIYTTKPTIYKHVKVDSSLIRLEAHKKSVKENVLIRANWIKDEDDHWLAELEVPVNGFYNWFFYKKDVEILHCYEEALVDSDYQSAEFKDVWTQAVKKAQTNGCGPITAKAEGVTANKEGSFKIAEKDLPHFDEALMANIKKASSIHNVPVAVIMAIASRESHVGTVLGQNGNRTGYGDNNHGFGIGQMDDRVPGRVVKGKPDPKSYAHIEQFVGLFASYLGQVSAKHFDWSDSDILKGAMVAYNSGVSSVQTIANMNKGTTNDDYGDDTMARAQFYLEKAF